MRNIHLPGAGGGASTADRPTAEPSGTAEEVLFREARRRERRRRAAISVGALLALGGLALGLVFATGGSPPRRPATDVSSGKRQPGAPGVVASHFTFRGNGIGAATFGQPEAVAITELDKVLGSPTTARPTSDAGNCTVDAFLTWPALTAYFFHGRFVGYNSGSLLDMGSGAPGKVPTATTAAGLRIGDDIEQARRIYGHAFVVLFAQGGSWRVRTSTGTLDGYLTAVPGGRGGQVPKVADVSAGSVGCPALSP